MSLDKPDIKYTPGEIDAESFGPPPFFRYYCEYHKIAFPDEDTYNKHMAKYHPGDPKKTFDNFVDTPDDFRGKFDPDEQKKIDDTVDGLVENYEEMQEITDVLENKLAAVNVTYDPKKYPQFHAANICPHCGVQGSPGVGSGASYSTRLRTRRNNQPAYIGFNGSDTDLTEHPAKTLERQNELAKGRMSMMFKALINTIISVFLGMWLSILKPFKLIFPISKLFKKAKKNEKKMSERGVGTPSFSDMQLQDDPQSDDWLNDAGTGFSGTDIANLAADEQNPICIEHDEIFLDQFLVIHDEHIEEDNNEDESEESTNFNVYAGLLSMTHSGSDSIKGAARFLGRTLLGAGKYQTSKGNSLDKIDPDAIGDDNATFDDDGNQIMKHDDTQPKDDKSRTWKILNSSWKGYIQRTKALFKSVADSDEVICCFIYNLTRFLSLNKTDLSLVISDKDKKRHLRNLIVLRTLLAQYHDIANLNFKKIIKRGWNLVVAVTSRFINNIIQMYTSMIKGYLKNSFNMWLDPHRAEGEKHGYRACIPWEGFLELIADLFGDIVDKFRAYLGEMWNGNLKLTFNASKSADQAALVIEFRKYLKLIDKMIEFLKFWFQCTDLTTLQIIDDTATNTQDGDDTESTGSFASAIRNADTTPSVITGSQDDQFAINAADADTAATTGEDATRELNHADPFSYEGINVLLTNFMGISKETVEKVFEETENGNFTCKSGFDPEELNTFKDII